LLKEIRNLPAYQQLRDTLSSGSSLESLGLPRAVRIPVAAALYQDLKRPILFISSRLDKSVVQIDEFDFWLQNPVSMHFTEPNPLFYEKAAWGAQTRLQRIKCLTSLAMTHRPGNSSTTEIPLIVAPVRAVMTRTLPRRDFIKSMKVLAIGKTYQIQNLQKEWTDIGYQRVDTVIEQGQFSRRGGILDVWTPAEEVPVRLDFFGDDLETIRKFDVVTQRTIEAIDKILITPAREIMPGNLPAELSQVDEQLLEFYLPYAHPNQASILDYLPDKSLVIFDDLDTLEISANEIEEQAIRFGKESILQGLLKETGLVPFISWSELFDSVKKDQWVDFGRSNYPSVSPLAECFTPGLRFGGKLKDVIDHLAIISSDGEKSMVVTRQSSRFDELLKEYGQFTLFEVKPQLVQGTLTEGTTLIQTDGSRYHLLTDSEIFGWERPRPRQQKRAAVVTPEAPFTDLTSGDYLVHIDYGIGIFRGLVGRIVDNFEREFLLIEYDAGDQLYVPIHQADRLTRYVGPDARAPSLTRLGTAEWEHTRSKVKLAVREIADELIQLYARRQMAKGYTYHKDTPWQKDMEASFPFIETEDQIKAIGEVKRDMESPRPMDRLLCGDVGYGKTEVALRASFKAVMDGRQVGILVPTTVLAQQHHETFRDRLAAYPVEVEMLSRFRNPKEQDAIIKRLGEGSIDIIIGTHRLLQSDVVFKDLGMLIIDEEQRFGVSHKEYFKKLRTELDVLTLSATPIPRTLYMALTGTRDISTINTAPEERLPISTFIGPYNPQLVKQALLRELERGGQVFFVHNRVHTIHGMGSHLANLVPEARIGIAHGQMPEDELSSVMKQFNSGDIDILLCTSIIESGLDIPNANTLIVDRGDTFGLAQLYQLRGRVGRGAQRAYAYFFRHARKPPTPEGLERLEIIAENTQLGAGYSIAMRDLEMRGAGELLGTKQHGYIASVGFHLYTRLLGQAVKLLRQGQLREDKNESSLQDPSQSMVSVDLPLSVAIPVDYIADQNIRLSLYRRMAVLNDEVELNKLMEEFKDRFGPPPKPLQNLFFQLLVRLRVQQAGLASVSYENEQFVLRLPSLLDPSEKRILPVIDIARAGKNSYWLPLDISQDDWKEKLLGTIDAIKTKLKEQEAA